MTLMEHIMRPIAVSRFDWEQSLRTFRYALSGALAGVALAGLAAWAFGAEQRDLHDLVGAAFGFVAVLGAKAYRDNIFS